MNLRLLILSATLLASFQIYAQSSPPIRGLVTDSLTGAALEDATVSLEGVTDRAALQRVRSNRNGFLLRRPAPGNYRLITTYLGYAPDTLVLALRATDTASRFVRIRLRPSANPLMQVVVRATIPPAIVRNDTIAFNAGAYPTRPNASVEDLLKRLPGIEVDKNGNITMQGRKVDKIYLDGKEFFLSDLKTATQNLPADLVAQVEAYDSQSEKARLTGVKEASTTKTLNIKLKKDKKRGYFGKLYAGAGNNSSYSAGGTITNLSSSRWLLGTVDANNINNQFTGAEHSYGPSTGGIQSFTNANLNYRDNWGPKVTATLNGGRNSSHNKLLSTTDRQTFLADSSLLENRYSRSDARNSGYHAFASFEYKIDSANILQMHSIWSSQQNDNSSLDSVAIRTQKPAHAYLSSMGVTNNTSSSKGWNLNHNIDYRHLFHKKGRSLYLGFSGSIQSQDMPAGLYSRVDAFDSTGHLVQRTLRDQRSGQHSSGGGYGVSFAYTEPVGSHHVLDVAYRATTNDSRSDKKSFDYDSATGKYDRLDTLTTNRFFNSNTVQYVSAGFNTTEGKLRYQLGIGAQFTDLRNDNYSLDSHLGQDFTNWFPRASLIWTLGKSKTLNLGYNGASRTPTIDQLQPLPDISNPFLVRLGNPSLQQQFDHSVNVNFNSFNSTNFRNFQASLDGNTTEHGITTATNLLPGGVQQVQYINVEGVYHLNANLNYGFPLGNKKGNGNAGLHGQYGHDISYVDGAANTTTSTGWGGRLYVNYHPLEKLFIDASAAADLTASDYSLNTYQSTKTSLQNYMLDASYEFPWALTVSSNYNLQITGSQAGLPSRQVTLWNASIYKTLFANHTGQLRLSAFDLLGAGTSYTQTVGTNYTETRQSNLPGRLWLLSFTYQFRKFPTAKGG